MAKGGGHMKNIGAERRRMHHQHERNEDVSTIRL
jgi:hypothetical protein